MEVLEQTASETRQAQTIAMRIVTRWKSKEKAAAWVTWCAVHATAKDHVLKTSKIVTRWQCIKQADAYATWQEQAKAQRKEHSASTRVLKHWIAKSLASAWGKWWEEIRRSRMARKVAIRWVQRAGKCVGHGACGRHGL